MLDVKKRAGQNMVRAAEQIQEIVETPRRKSISSQLKSNHFQ